MLTRDAHAKSYIDAGMDGLGKPLDAAQCMQLSAQLLSMRQSKGLLAGGMNILGDCRQITQTMLHSSVSSVFMPAQLDKHLKQPHLSSNCTSGGRPVCKTLAKDGGSQDVVPAVDHEHGKASFAQLSHLSIRDAV